MARKRNTKLEILRAAETLFQTKGIDGVSMREISAAAGQKNHSAAQYHFGSIDGVINGILDRHSLALIESWNKEFDRFGHNGPMTLDDIMRVLVTSMMEKLEDPDGGKEFVCISSVLVDRPDFPFIQRSVAMGEGMTRLREAVSASNTKLSPLVLEIRLQLAVSTMYQAFSNYIREMWPIERDDFLVGIIDVLLGIITAPCTQN